MPKVVTSIRLDVSVRDRFNAYNNIREYYGFRRYSMAEAVEDCLDLWIQRDKDTLGRRAVAMKDELDSFRVPGDGKE